VLFCTLCGRPFINPSGSDTETLARGVLLAGLGWDIFEYRVSTGWVLPAGAAEVLERFLAVSLWLVEALGNSHPRVVPPTGQGQQEK